MNYTSEGDLIRVLVTGFGAFSHDGIDINVNASGEAVKLLNKDHLESKLNIKLVTEEVRVEYKYIDEVVSIRLKELQPHLMIHVGLSDKSQGFMLETKARKTEYSIEDNIAECPANAVNPCGGPETLTTVLHVEHICNQLNLNISDDDEWSFKAHVSEDAGNYVCEYIYYTSLSHHNESRNSLFIHVPPVTTPEDIETLAQGLERILEICVALVRMQDIKSSECESNY